MEWGPLEKLGVPELVKNQFAPEKENFPFKEHFVQLRIGVGRILGPPNNTFGLKPSILDLGERVFK